MPSQRYIESRHWCNFRHGHAISGQESATYYVWKNLIQRCTNPNRPDFERWGGRGITVCVEWRNSFTAFLQDMGERPPGLRIERVDNNGPYCKSNCVWATQRQQCQNTRRNYILTVLGATGCLSELCRHLGVDFCRTQMRLRHGWEPMPAFFAIKRTRKDSPAYAQWCAVQLPDHGTSHGA
jgi:hypothetical protein